MTGPTAPRPAAAPRRVVLCADDFGLAPDVNAGILRLADAGRITAVSCLVEGPAWNLGAAELAGVAGRADVGLHLFLGTGSGGGALAYAARGVLGLVDASDVERQIRGQLDRFEKDCGRQPVFVDGHHHVHQMWPVREVLLRVLRARYPERVPYVRNTVPLHPRGAKGAVIAALGGHALLRLLREGRVPHNPDFAGVYDLSPRSDFRSLMRAWLDSIADRGLLMCHPGLPVQGLDRFGEARGAELRHLESDRFGEDCESALVRLVRPSETIA